MNEFRRDPVSGRIVIIASARDSRPNQFSTDLSTQAEPEDVGEVLQCQFCAEQMNTPPIIARYGTDAGSDTAEDWQVCVVPNLYPSLDENAHESWQRNVRLESPKHDFELPPIPAYGLHEVVIESPTHVTRTSDLSAEQFRWMLFAYRDRMRFMLSQQDIRYVQVIKNYGEAAGASIRHSHSQVFGIPFVPSQVELEVRGAKDVFSIEKQCVFCQTIQQELSANQRIVSQTDEFIAWCPYASRVGYELHIAPKTHVARFEDSTEQRIEALAEFMQPIVRRLESHPRIKALNYLIHSLPKRLQAENEYHWHIELLPRIAKEAGFEWGTGVHINTVSPERAAEELRV